MLPRMEIRRMTISLVAALFHFILANRYNSIKIFCGATTQKRSLGRLTVGVSRPHTHNYTQTQTSPRARYDYSE